MCSWACHVLCFEPLRKRLHTPVSQAGALRWMSTTFFGLESQWSVRSRCRFVAIKSIVTTTARRQRVNSWAYIMVFDFPPRRFLIRPCSVSRCRLSIRPSPIPSRMTPAWCC
eukprot:9206799-Lingulodinium_polyedra.AAC.1